MYNFTEWKTVMKYLLYTVIHHELKITEATDDY